MIWDVRRFDTIDSTNRYLLEEAEAGAPAGLVAAASHQTSGRGRRGRVWDSKPGASLLISVLFRPSADDVMVRYPQAFALAVSDACATVCGFEARLKWPNDVVVVANDGYRKLAGVLSEFGPASESVLVVGCGINLNWGGEMPDALRQIAVSADELTKFDTPNERIDDSQFLDAVLKALNERLARPTWISESYRQRCVTIGTTVRVEQSETTLTGVAESVTDGGALVVRSENSDVTEVTIGDVVHVR